MRAGRSLRGCGPSSTACRCGLNEALGLALIDAGMVARMEGAAPGRAALALGSARVAVITAMAGAAALRCQGPPRSGVNRTLDNIHRKVGEIAWRWFGGIGKDSVYLYLGA